MTKLLDGVKTISLVGNGPISREAAAGIDSADLVIRFNQALLCRVAGKRTDVLVVNGRWFDPSRAVRGRPAHPHVLKDAREIWVRKLDNPGDISLRDRPVFEYAKDGTEALSRELTACGATVSHPRPTLGLSTLDFLLRSTDAHVTLYGFTHQGEKVHSWDAERRWFDDKVEQGRVTRAPLNGPLVRQPFGMVVRHQVMRVVNHARSMIRR